MLPKVLDAGLNTTTYDNKIQSILNSGNKFLLAAATASVKKMVRASRDFQMFKKFSAEGLGMQDGKRGDTLDFVETCLIVQHLEVVPIEKRLPKKKTDLEWLTKDQSYTIFAQFLNQLNAAKESAEVQDGLESTEPHGRIAKAGPPLRRSPSRTTSENTYDLPLFGRTPSRTADNTHALSQAQAKDDARQELDFHAYTQFMEYILHILGLEAVLERELELMRVEMERTRLRCAVAYD